MELYCATLWQISLEPSLQYPLISMLSVLHGQVGIKKVISMPQSAIVSNLSQGDSLGFETDFLSVPLNNIIPKTGSRSDFIKWYTLILYNFVFWCIDIVEVLLIPYGLH